MADFSPLEIRREVELGGQSRKLLFTMGAIVEAERILGRSIVFEVQGLEENPTAIRFDFLAAVICGAMRARSGRKYPKPELVISWLPSDLNKIAGLYQEILPPLAELLGAGADESEDEDEEQEESEAGKAEPATPSAGLSQ